MSQLWWAPSVVLAALQSLQGIAADADTISSIVSFQFEEAIDQQSSDLSLTSAMVSYQFFDWLGDENVTFERSLPVSYKYIELPPVVASVQGRVTNLSNRATLDAATVKAIQNGQVASTSTTDPSGSYVISIFAEGVYELRASKTDFLTTIQSGVRVSRGQNIAVDFSLEPRPPPPKVLPATEPLPQSVLDIPKLNARLVPVPTVTTIDRNKITTVLTHGWNSTFLDWPSLMATKLASRSIENKANILAWDWGIEAVGLLPPIEKTPRQGQALGQALMSALGERYQRPIHFIGHSLGTIVNAQAVEFLYSHGYTPENVPVHVTLFDEAEIANAKASLENLFSVGASAQDIYLPLPTKYKWADSYVSLVAGLSLAFRTDSVSVVLWPTHDCGPFSLLRLSCSHAYPFNWYLRTISTPSLSSVGFTNSFEWNNLQQAPALGSIYLQDAATGKEFDFKYFSPNTELPSFYSSIASIPSIIGTTVSATAGLALDAYTAVNKERVRFLNGSTAALQSFGRNVVDWSEGFAGTVSSWTYQLTLRLPDVSPRSVQGLRLETGDKPSTSSFVVLPIIVPADAIGLSFEYALEGTMNTGLFSVGLAGTNIFTMKSDSVRDQSKVNSGILSVARWQGKSVNLSVGFSDPTNGGGGVVVSGIRFYGENAPPLAAVGGNQTLTLAWPVAAYNYILEMADTLTSTAWIALTNNVTSDKLVNTLTLPTPERSRFFRLRKARE